MEQPLEERKWLALPDNPEPNTKYFIVAPDRKSFRFYITTATGELTTLRIGIATKKYFIGAGASPVNYEVKPTGSILQDDELIGAMVFGMLFMDNVPMEIDDAGILFNNETGSLNFDVLGGLFDGQKIVMTIIK